MELKGQISLAILTVSLLAFQLSLRFFPTVPGFHGEVGFRSATHPAVADDPQVFLSGVSIHDGGDFPVVQQPLGDTNYVSKNDDEVTQFSSANQYGNIGLLAHNYLSGKSFSKIHIGQEIQLKYSNGRTENFIVTDILRYKALDPKSPYSSFQNLDKSEEILTVSQMFDRAYQGSHHVTFQTCISAEGNSSWGRLFVIASPKLNKLGYNPSGLP